MAIINGKPCPTCGTVQAFEVSAEQMSAYQAGAFIQAAFPHLSPDDREALMTGYCGPCWDALFPEEEE